MSRWVWIAAAVEGEEEKKNGPMRQAKIKAAEQFCFLDALFLL